MIRRSTWILLGIFGLLLVVVWWLEASPEDALEAATPTPAPPDLLDVTADEVESLRIAGLEGREVAIIREGEEWTLTIPAGETGDPVRMDAAAARLANLDVLATLDDDLSPEDVGLGPPRYRLFISLSDGRELEVQVGDATPTGSGYYARRAGGPILVLSQAAASLFIDLVSDPPILEPTPTAP